MKRQFLICIHDATPAFARETRKMVRDLAPLLGRRLSLGVVPDWHGAWSLKAHPNYCRWLQESAEELLLHGYFHKRQRGWGVTSWMTEGADEMNGLTPEETWRTLERGQSVFAEAFGAPAHGFLAPGWQRAHVRRGMGSTLGIEHVLGLFSLDAWTGQSMPLATWSWDWGRFGWFGCLGHAIGWLCHGLNGGVPTLALHPRDVARGYWPIILRLTQQFLEAGYKPSTVAGVLSAPC